MNRLQNAALDDANAEAEAEDGRAARESAIEIMAADFDAECVSGVMPVASRRDSEEASLDDDEEDTFDVEAFVAMTTSDPPPAA